MAELDRAAAGRADRALRRVRHRRRRRKEAFVFALIGFLTSSGCPATVPSCTGARHGVDLSARSTPGAFPLRLTREAAPSRRPALTRALAAAARRRSAAAPLDPRPAGRSARRRTTVELVRGVDLDVSRRREARHRRRERLGQDAHDAVGAAAPAVAARRSSAGEVDFAGEDLAASAPRAAPQVRGGEVAMVYQDPMSSLEPAAAGGVADRGDPPRARCRRGAGAPTARARCSARSASRIRAA